MRLPWRLRKRGSRLLILSRAHSQKLESRPLRKRSNPCDERHRRDRILEQSLSGIFRADRRVFAVRASKPPRLLTRMRSYQARQSEIIPVAKYRYKGFRDWPERCITPHKFAVESKAFQGAVQPCSPFSVCRQHVRREVIPRWSCLPRAILLRLLELGAAELHPA